MSDLDLGPCQVLFGTAGAESDLGKTQGGVRVAFATDVADLMSDQFGTQPEEQVLTGQGATITCPLADYTLDNLAKALNMTLKSYGADKGIKGSLVVGTKMTASAKSLLLKKYVDGAVSTDQDDWMRFPLAAPTGNFEVVFDGSSQRIIEVVFRAYPDANSVLYFLGDENAAESGS